jgi:hypothetical protein
VGADQADFGESVAVGSLNRISRILPNLPDHGNDLFRESFFREFWMGAVRRGIAEINMPSTSFRCVVSKTTKAEKKFQKL